MKNSKTNFTMPKSWFNLNDFLILSLSLSFLLLLNVG